MLEKLLKENPPKGIAEIVLYTEEISKNICIEEKLEYALEMSQKERLELLNNEEIIEDNVSVAFDIIRFVGNAAVKGLIEIGIEEGIKLYNSYKVIVDWVSEMYSFSLDSELNDKYESVEIALSKSNLLTELYKLRESSKEAVEGATELSEFKRYLHVERGIQQELIDTLEQAKNSKSGKLIVLCGSVGDGKSHLLAYLSNEYPSLIKEYTIHNDATESFDPTKSSIETLAEVLESFSDNKINFSKEKVILAINLGVLYNFLESNIGRENFKKFKRFVDVTGLFDVDKISESIVDENFSLVSFSDYNLYELTEGGPKSAYISSLLSKIAGEDKENPFYKGYLMDIKEGYWSPIIENYRILLSKDVQGEIVQLLIKVMVEQKKLISTRELLNFIYDILVPSTLNIVEDGNFSLEYCNNLLPNLLFDNKGKSKLLDMLSKEDPINYREKALDEFILRLNISDNIGDVITENIKVDYLDNFIKACYEIGRLEELSSSIRSELIDTILRSSLLLGKEIRDVFTNEIYDDYLNYLYHYNLQSFVKYKKLFEEIREGISRWNGSPKKEYLYLNYINGDMKVAERVRMKATLSKEKLKYKRSMERFKNTVLLTFKIEKNDEIVQLELDYSLYKNIRSVLRGYCPNKKDREESIVFTEFVERLLKQGEKDKELIINDIGEKLLFKLEYDEDFEIFSFKRVD